MYERWLANYLLPTSTEVMGCNCCCMLRHGIGSSALEKWVIGKISIFQKRWLPPETAMEDGVLPELLHGRIIACTHVVIWGKSACVFTFGLA